MPIKSDVNVDSFGRCCIKSTWSVVNKQHSVLGIHGGLFYLCIMKAFFLLFSVIFISGCNLLGIKPKPAVDSFNSNFDSSPKITYLKGYQPNQASGMADSYQFPKHVWVEENGNTSDAFYLYDYEGIQQGTIKTPFKNYDWEDMAIGFGPEDGQKYIYMADIGDNFGNRKEYQIYRFKEPTFKNGTLKDYDTISFVYPDAKNKDSEAIIIDPKTKDIYIFTKELSRTQVYKLAYPQAYGNNVSTAELVKNLPFFILTSAGISVNADEIVLKNYGVIYYWYVKTGETFMSTLSRQPDKYLPYTAEPQGEAFCFANDGKSYFSMSEAGNAGVTPPMRQYFRSTL